MQGVDKNRIILPSKAESLSAFCEDYGITWTTLSDRDRLVCIQIVLNNENSKRTREAYGEFKQTVIDILNQIKVKDTERLVELEAELDRIIKKVKDSID